MITPTRPPKNTFNALARKVYNPLGFNKSYNFLLWFIFAGGLFGFTLARFMYLNFDGNFCPAESKGGNSAAPGECYYYQTFSRYKIGILLHLAGILPASILVVLQFTPFIRHKWILIHRICGYAAILLYIVSLAGVLMIARRAFGGGLDVQSWCGFVGIGVLICFIISWINIKRLQIEQHRAWMLRGWFYAGSIITTRIIMIITAKIIAGQGYYIVWTCAKIASTISNNATLLAQDYPSCASYADRSNLDAVSAVSADMNGTATNVGAALNMSFGTALWLAFALHALGVEVYLRLTPNEAERLRGVSYTRQLEAGMRKPGSAGLTSDRLGDAPGWAGLMITTNDVSTKSKPSS